MLEIGKTKRGCPGPPPDLPIGPVGFSGIVCKMPCSRGAASPKEHTKRRLSAASGGYCQNPGCNCELFLDIEGRQFQIAEIAHVFSANDSGPRSGIALTQEERGAFENLILLCPTCHTKIDKAPEVYSDSVVLSWKRDHDRKLDLVFGVRHFESREDARLAITPLLAENRHIFESYGPNAEDAWNPESGAAERWARKVLGKILPNNRRILAHLDKNRHLLADYELLTLEAFRQHVDDLEARHIEGFEGGAARFPSGMVSMLSDQL